MTHNYLDMMADSLDRKIVILEELDQICLEQKKLFAQGADMDDEAFDTSVERKGALIDELEKLDDGFASLFDHVKAEIGDNKDKYVPQILAMQERIRKVTALSGSVEAQEKRNKAAADRYFAAAREELKQGRKSSGTAMLYYQNMNKSTNIQPQFFDSKK